MLWMDSRTRKPSKVFDVFVIASRSQTNELTIIYKYPEHTDLESSYLDEVCRFSIPVKIDQIEKSENFTFILTDSDGLYRFGHCWLNRKSDAVESFCFVSDLAYFERFRCILAKVSRTSIDLLGVSVLDELYQTTIDDFLNISPDSTSFDSKCSGDNEASEFCDLATELGSDVLATIFRVLLYERSLLLVCSSLDKLSSCAIGCLKLLCPLQWQSTVIPVLPEHLFDFVNMPCPYIIGVHSSLMVDISIRSRISDTTIVDLRASNVKVALGLDLEPLPRHINSQQLLYNEPLVSDGTKDDKSTMDRRRVSTLSSHALLAYLTDDIDSFISDKIANDQQQQPFDEQAFLTRFESKRDKNRVERIMKTLMFTEFIDRRKRRKLNVEGSQSISSLSSSKMDKTETDKSRRRLSIKSIRNSFRKRSSDRSSLTQSSKQGKSTPKLDRLHSIREISGFTSFFHFKKVENSTEQSLCSTNTDATISASSFESVNSVDDEPVNFESSMDLSELIVMINQKLPGRLSSQDNDCAHKSDFVGPANGEA